MTTKKKLIVYKVETEKALRIQAAILGIKLPQHISDTLDKQANKK